MIRSILPILVLALLSTPVTVEAGNGTLPCGYDVTEIVGPSYPPFFPSTFVALHDMNDAGVAVGSISLLDPYPCTWSAEQGLACIPMPAGVTEGTAVRINSNGWILVNAQTTWAGMRGFVLVPPEQGGWGWIEMQPASGMGWTYVHGINDLNEVVGSQSVGVPPDFVYPLGGFRWGPTQPLTTIVLPGWKATVCMDINDAGVICGNVSQQNQASEGNPSVRGFVLDEGGATLIEPPAPYTRSGTRRINSSGVVGGNFLSLTGGTWQIRGFLMEPGGSAPAILPPPAGYVRWILADINDSGVAVGTADPQPPAVNSQICVATVAASAAIPELVEPPFATGSATGFGITDDGELLGQSSSGSMRIFSPQPSVPADLDCDGAVGPSDLAALIGAWGKRGAAADLDGDGVVGGGDLGMILAAWAAF